MSIRIWWIGEKLEEVSTRHRGLIMAAFGKTPDIQFIPKTDITKGHQIAELGTEYLTQVVAQGVESKTIQESIDEGYSPLTFVEYGKLLQLFRFHGDQELSRRLAESSLQP